MYLPCAVPEYTHPPPQKEWGGNFFKRNKFKEMYEDQLIFPEVCVAYVGGIDIFWNYRMRNPMLKKKINNNDFIIKNIIPIICA